MVMGRAEALALHGMGGVPAHDERAVSGAVETRTIGQLPRTGGAVQWS